jgi:hypothetical protein
MKTRLIRSFMQHSMDAQRSSPESVEEEQNSKDVGRLVTRKVHCLVLGARMYCADPGYYIEGDRHMHTYEAGMPRAYICT